MPRRRKPTVLSAFTGAGGLDLGLERAGFRILGCIEFDDVARETIRRNRPRHRLLQPHDITELVATLKPRDVGLRRRGLDVLAGAPPCQPFSKAAQWSPKSMQGLADPRMGSLRAFMTLADQFLPKVVLVENVPGFVRGETSVLAFMRRAFRRLNREYGTSYELHAKIVNAVDYGVAQRRERAIIIAARDGRRITWPSPTHRYTPARAYDALRTIKATNGKRPKGRWAGLLPSIPEGSNYIWHTSEGGGRQMFGYRTRYWSFLLKLAKDQPAWTLSAHPGPATGPFHWMNRPLTVKEMLRLQSFPASWRVAGTQSEQVRQVGNATPPLLAEIVGRMLGEDVFGLVYNKPPTLRISQARAVPFPERPKRVPRRYLALVSEHEPHPGTGRGPSPRTF